MTIEDTNTISDLLLVNLAGRSLPRRSMRASRDSSVPPHNVDTGTGSSQSLLGGRVSPLAVGLFLRVRGGVDEPGLGIEDRDWDESCCSRQ